MPTSQRRFTSIAGVWSWLRHPLKTRKTEENIQFILATHSPSIVDQAANEELYLLRPPELAPGENQLLRVANDEERLSVLRNAFGSTSNLTAMRTVLVVEGASAERRSRSTSDAKIYGHLNDQFGKITILSGGGKSECSQLLKSLNDALAQLGPQLTAVALLDRDTLDDPPTASNVAYLPVSMIENLLIDPHVIFRAISAVQHKTTFKSPDEVSIALNLILDDLFEHEVSRRVKAGVRPEVFRLRDPVEDARRQVESFASELLGKLSDDNLASIHREATTTVNVLKDQAKRREFFDGKKIIDKFHKQHLHATGMSKEICVYLCAQEARSRKSVANFVESLFATIGATSPERAAKS